MQFTFPSTLNCSVTSLQQTTQFAVTAANHNAVGSDGIRSDKMR